MRIAQTIRYAAVHSACRTLAWHRVGRRSRRLRHSLFAGTKSTRAFGDGGESSCRSSWASWCRSWLDLTGHRWASEVRRFSSSDMRWLGLAYTRSSPPDPSASTPRRPSTTYSRLVWDPSGSLVRRSWWHSPCAGERQGLGWSVVSSRPTERCSSRGRRGSRPNQHGSAGIRTHGTLPNAAAAPQLNLRTFGRQRDERTRLDG
jgi:hypothetical protein